MTYASHSAITPHQHFVNLSSQSLIEMAIQRGEGVLAANGALVVKTGSRTGRSPKDRFIVKDAITDTTVAWNAINQPITPEKFAALWQKASAYLNEKDCQFVSDLRVGEHQQLGLNVKVITELAWHNLFAQVLFIRPAMPTIAEEKTQWTILNTPGFLTDAMRDGVNSDAAVILNFSEKRILICGTQYAGEMKKAMFSVLNFLLTDYEVLPMHCAANTGDKEDVVLFFGLSGTGKTTLSADDSRFLIGDDEHGWGKEGVFNFEGGCYAKCIDLSEEKEPLIWHAIREGAVIENVVLNPTDKTPNYADSSLTQNTRAAYPREFIKERVIENCGGQPKAVIFLTCDLYGVLPPVAKLNPDQAAYYFLSGYTALVGSTEVGQGTGIKPTFSTCFGAPFFPRPPQVYANLLIKLLNENKTPVYLVNTGWTGGAYGEGGTRFSIPISRSIVRAIVTGELQDVPYENLPGFNLLIPTVVSSIPNHLLDPRKAYLDESQYQKNASTLIMQFIENFKRFDVSDAVRQAGPTLLF